VKHKSDDGGGMDFSNDNDVKTIRSLYTNLSTKILTLAELSRANSEKIAAFLLSLNGTVDSPGWMTRTRLLEERVAVLEERITNIKEGIIFRFEKVELMIDTISKNIEVMHTDIGKILKAFASHEGKP
jgi:hypothetical protein